MLASQNDANMGHRAVSPGPVLEIPVLDRALEDSVSKWDELDLAQRVEFAGLAGSLGYDVD